MLYVLYGAYTNVANFFASCLPPRSRGVDMPFTYLHTAQYSVYFDVLTCSYVRTYIDSQIHTYMLVQYHTYTSNGRTYPTRVSRTGTVREPLPCVRAVA